MLAYLNDHSTMLLKPCLPAFEPATSIWDGLHCYVHLAIQATQIVGENASKSFGSCVCTNSGTKCLAKHAARVLMTGCKMAELAKPTRRAKSSSLFCCFLADGVSASEAKGLLTRGMQLQGYFGNEITFSAFTSAIRSYFLVAACTLLIFVAL